MSVAAKYHIFIYPLLWGVLMKPLSLGISLFLFFLTIGTAWGQYVQQVNNGQTTQPVSVPGSGCSYTWINQTPGIGLPASGSGNIPAFKAINYGTTPIVAVIKATPTSSGGYAYMTDNYASAVTVVDITTNLPVATIPVGYGPLGLSVSPDGSRVYVSNADQTISIIGVSTNTVIGTVNGLGQYIASSSVSPDGKWLYVANFGSSYITVVNTITQNIASTVNIGSASFNTCVNSDGSLLYVSGATSNRVTVLNTSTFTTIANIPVGKAPWGMTLSPDGSKLYVANSVGNSVSVIDTKLNSVIATIPVGPDSRGLSVTPDGTTLYVSNLNDRVINPIYEIYVINTATNKVIRTIIVPGGSWNLNVSPDGKNVYVPMPAENQLAVISTATNTLTETIPVNGHPVSEGNFISGCKQLTLTVTIQPPPSPSMLATGTIPALSTVYGTPSAAAAFSVSGTNMRSGVLVTPPKGFEVSSDGKVFGSSVTIGAAGTIPQSLVYIRLASTTSVGTYSGNVTLSSTGTTDLDEATKLSAVTPAKLTIVANDVNKHYGTELVNENDSKFSATGLQNNETVGYVDITFGNGASATSAPGKYPGSVIATVAQSGTFSPSNYSITYVPGDILIELAELTITADDKIRLIDSRNPILTITYTGFVNNDIPANLTTPSLISTTALTTSPVGKYPITVSGATSHNYTITFINGTLTIVDQLPTALLIPNTFTPNGDGINDTWEISALKRFTSCSISIFTRYGMQVYHAVGYDHPWDGTYKGKQLPTGTYYYVILPQPGMNELAGPITIIR